MPKSVYLIWMNEIIFLLSIVRRTNSKLNESTTLQNPPNSSSKPNNNKTINIHRILYIVVIALAAAAAVLVAAPFPSHFLNDITSIKSIAPSHSIRMNLDVCQFRLNENSGKFYQKNKNSKHNDENASKWVSARSQTIITHLNTIGKLYKLFLFCLSDRLIKMYKLCHTNINIKAYFFGVF